MELQLFSSLMLLSLLPIGLIVCGVMAIVEAYAASPRRYRRRRGHARRR